MQKIIIVIISFFTVNASCGRPRLNIETNIDLESGKRYFVINEKESVYVRQMGQVVVVEIPSRKLMWFDRFDLNESGRDFSEEIDINQRKIFYGERPKDLNGSPNPISMYCCRGFIRFEDEQRKIPIPALPLKKGQKYNINFTGDLYHHDGSYLEFVH